MSEDMRESRFEVSALEGEEWRIFQVEKMLSQACGANAYLVSDAKGVPIKANDGMYTLITKGEKAKGMALTILGGMRLSLEFVEVDNS